MTLSHRRDPSGPLPLQFFDSHPAGVLTLRNATQADAPFVNDLTRQTMTPLVRKTWESDEELERYFDKNRYIADSTKIIELNGIDVGRVTLLWSDEEVYVDQIHLLPAWQGQGLGTRVLERIIVVARRLGRAVRLQCLRANPAVHLYRRLGFEEYDRSITHYFLRIPAGGPSAR